MPDAMDFMMLLPPPNDNRNLDDIEKDKPFVTYVWDRPLCPWCAQWLRFVDFRPVGLSFGAKAGCPNFHGLWAFGQDRWLDVRPPKNIERGGDGAWWSTISEDELNAARKKAN